MQDDGGVEIRGPLLPTGHLRKLVRRQGIDSKQGIERFHAQLDRLTELINSHLDIKKELPEIPDDIMDMLVEQAKAIEDLHGKLCAVGRMLGAQDETSGSSGIEGSSEIEESSEIEGTIEGDSMEDDDYVEG